MSRRLVWFLRLLLALAGILVAFLLWAFWPESASGDLAGLSHAGDGYRVEIVRDTFGVPHVFGPRDVDVAYGLAYAHAEDDFATIQRSVLAARGRLATIDGKGAAPIDYMVQLLRVWDTVRAGYETDVSPQMRSIVEAYAAGLNQYAARHAGEALPGLFPVTGEDIVAISVLEAPLFFGLDETLGALFADERPTFAAASSPAAPFGSNVLAVGPSRAAGGHTLFLSNSHQPWDGPVAWYEASVHSDEGWDFTGALFPGMPVHALGTNGDLAWSFTVNHPDLVDVYLLDVDPNDPDRYRVDGRWLRLEKRDAPITVRIFGRFRWTVHEEALWSIYGPVVRRPHGTYAIRYAGMGLVGIYDQLYDMARAHSLDEWLEPLRRQDGLPSFNAGYADRDGNVAYVYNALLPLRASGYDWGGLVPGDTRRTLWTQYLPFDELPTVRNPPSGFVVNANSAPWKTTTGPGNPRPWDYAASFGIEEDPTNRSLRALTLLGRDESVTLDDFLAVKFDVAYDPRSLPARWADRLASADPARLAARGKLDAATVRRAQEVLRGWDRTADLDDTATALVVATLSYVYDATRDEPRAGFDVSRLVSARVPDAVLEQAFVDAIGWLARTRGTLTPRWGDVNRLRRGPVDMPVDGGPDLLRAVYGQRGDDGTFTGIAGDSYVLLVDWAPDGTPTLRSIHQYGAATSRPDSPHYSDQAPLFARGELKPVWFDEADIRAHAESVSSPGGDSTAQTR